MTTLFRNTICSSGLVSVVSTGGRNGFGGAAASLFGAAQHRLLSSGTAQPPSSDPAVVPAAGATGKTVVLDYEKFEPSGEAKKAKSGSVPISSLVVCHGLFGSKQNWRSLGRAMSSRFGVPVYAVDLRNHGTSPHIDGLAYEDMAADVIEFMSTHNIQNSALIGHSMGGKVSMSVALHPSLPKNMLSHLVSVDMAARRGPLSPEFEKYIQAMLDIKQQKCKTRSEADDILKLTEPDLGVRQFLLTNLTRLPETPDVWSWRIPVEMIQKHISQIGDFPYDAPGESESKSESGSGSSSASSSSSGTGNVRSSDIPTLFIKGSRSKYVNRKNIPTNLAYFPNSKLVHMDTGHWCQAEKPNEFVQVIHDFLTNKTQDQTQDALKPRSSK
ncbi:alpha/beta-hydrolase [Testicularia cyperi]|uniref:Alpha/beta-hydrolase n=1 Tax=Testicularia cyperi TaxID=1882483 RepID=A0A317XNY8_9BASI|nr:alpha/beta-hydrolase [Testicularia cyperi]